MLSLVYRQLSPSNKKPPFAISFAFMGVALAIFLHIDNPSALGAPSCDIVQTDVRWSALRSEFYHRAQGTKLIPMSWFLALEQKNSSKKFLDIENLSQFGFIPDDKHKQYNPEGL